MRSPRPISDALTPAMRGALAGLRGERFGGTEPPQGSTARGLAARRLLAPGCSRLRLRPTPLGRQVAAMLVDLCTMRDALASIEIELGRLRINTVNGEVYAPAREHASPGDLLTGARDTALRALARSRRWVP